MDFRDEYKKEITELSSDETARRIREGVMARLEQSESSAPEAPVKKKPLPIKRIAVIGGSIAACLVIGFTALAVSNSRLGQSFIGSGMANNVGAPGTAGVASPGSSRPSSIIADGAVNGADGGLNTEQTNDDTVSDIDKIGGHFSGGTAASETQSVPPSENDPSQNESEPEYIASGSGATVITFEDGGITLTDYHGTKFFPAAEEEYDEYGIGSTLTEHELRDTSEVVTEEGEHYIVMQKYNRIVLLNDKLKVIGVYVIF